MIATHQNVTTDLDLGSSGAPPRNWKGIGIAMVVIIVVLSLVIVSVILLTPDESRLLLQSRLTLEDLDKSEYFIHRSDATWISDSELALRSRDGHVILLNMRSGQRSTLVDNSTFVTLKATRYQVSPDLNFILLAYNVQQVHTRSFLASYAIYNVATREIMEIKPPEAKTSVLQFAAWGPLGNQLVYIFESNIYYQQDTSSSALRLTSTGRDGIVLNGISDWLYEEEVLQTYIAHWWSSDGARLAYLMINNTATPIMEIPQFLGGVYPVSTHYPYPKAGQPLPSVKLFVVNLYGPAHTLELISPDDFRNRECYIPMVMWISSTRLAVRWLNRAQNMSVLTICEATTGACVEKHKTGSDTWLIKQEAPLFQQDGSVFFLTIPAKQGARGEFHHVAMLSAQPGSSPAPLRFLTSGDWDVTSLCALDEARGKIYFLSTEVSSRSRHLYSANTMGGFHRSCLTCDLVANCSFFTAKFSPNKSYFMLRCEGPGVPKVTAHQTDNPSSFILLEDNQILKEALEVKRLPLTKFQTIPGEGYEVQLKLALPTGYQDAVFPLLFLVDGTPGSQSVTDHFQLDWTTALSSSAGVVVAQLDGRGGGNRGQKLQHEIHQKLGSLEVKDHMMALGWLLQQPYVDRRRIALYGKAYGGYLALKMLATTAQQFRCVVAVAPIVDFRLYAAAFSERYLGLPSKEESLYAATSLLGEAHKLKGEHFLLVHGTADAKVHFQHSAELLHHLILVEANYTLQDFKAPPLSQVYPDEGHALQSERSRQHLQHTLHRYLLGCFQNPKKRTSDADEE
ncbi:inactive dipeptidyl peptidase 10 isoform X2 [Erpetoichthys calabaricus]|uniref:inactive dipeptidyl peptidase 10 isoform X2 n=1 Tax=Erpetoichthys calabaricus TaxID=27687 RepID=UPI00223450DC|nr:inactive dipeptidyl peptidase 10 isoform X2 [Erpetoichthys calabaricus]